MTEPDVKEEASGDMQEMSHAGMHHRLLPGINGAQQDADCSTKAPKYSVLMDMNFDVSWKHIYFLKTIMQLNLIPFISKCTPFDNSP